MSSQNDAVPPRTNYRKGDTIVVTIEKIVPRGYGLGFAEGLTVLVPLAAVGDVVRVEIRELKKRLAFAEIVDIERPGEARIPAPCPHYGICGGCDLQHLTYQAQLQAKVDIIRDCLTRIGKIEFAGDIPIISSPQEFGYRSRARWHLDPETQAFGYMQRLSNEVVDVSVCPILTPPMQATLGQLRESSDRQALGKGRYEIEAASGEDGPVSVYSPRLGTDADAIATELVGESYSYSAETFFQANTSLIPDLVNAALGDAAGNIALDLYCGVGLFTLPLARRFQKVIGVEGNKEAVKFAQLNAANAGLTNAEFTDRAVGRFLKAERMRNVDLVVLDPPRTGPEDGVVEALAAKRPARISYISCEPSIVARDLKQLLAAGFSIESITALDLFPQTHHVETVVHLKA